MGSTAEVIHWDAPRAAPLAEPAYGLGEKLAWYFDRLCEGPMPAHLLDLVEQLEQRRLEELSAAAPAMAKA